MVGSNDQPHNLLIDSIEGLNNNGNENAVLLLQTEFSGNRKSHSDYLNVEKITLRKVF